MARESSRIVHTMWVNDLEVCEWRNDRGETWWTVGSFPEDFRSLREAIRFAAQQPPDPHLA